MSLNNVVIAAWARTPIGKFNGALGKLTAPSGQLRIVSGRTKVPSLC